MFNGILKNDSDSLKWVMEGNMNFFAKAFTVFKGSMGNINWSELSKRA